MRLLFLLSTLCASQAAARRHVKRLHLRYVFSAQENISQEKAFHVKRIMMAIFKPFPAGIMRFFLTAAAPFATVTVIFIRKTPS